MASSSEKIGGDDDRALDDRLGKNGRGGARPSSSKDLCFASALEYSEALSLRAGDFSDCLSACDCVSLCNGDGERSCLAPKKFESSPSWSFCRPRGTSGIESGSDGIPPSGVGGTRLMRGCMDFGLELDSNGSSSSVFKPKPSPVRFGESPASDGDSWDRDRK